MSTYKDLSTITKQAEIILYTAGVGKTNGAFSNGIKMNQFLFFTELNWQDLNGQFCEISLQKAANKALTVATTYVYQMITKIFEKYECIFLP